MSDVKPRPLPAQLFSLVHSGMPDELLGAMTACNWHANEIDNQGLTLLFRAVFHGRFDNADMLLKAGADINYADHHGWTPLFWATYNQQQQAVRYLIAHGANPNLRNLDGEWPLFWAVFHDNWDIVSLLLLGGADPSWTDANGQDIFWLAQQLGRNQMLSQLSSFRRSI